MDMLDPAYLIVSFLVSVVGFTMFLWGKRQSQFVMLIGGLIMMIFPYVVHNVLAIVGIAAAIGAGVWFIERR